MKKRGYLIIGVIGLIAAGGLALFLVLTQSELIFQWDGEESGNPTGQTIILSGTALKPNKFAIVVGVNFRYSSQEHEIGTFNLTLQCTGQEITISYELSAGTFVGMHYAGVTLELPPGSYTISAENHHLGGASCDQVLWQGMVLGAAVDWNTGLEIAFGGGCHANPRVVSPCPVIVTVGVSKGRSGASNGGSKRFKTQRFVLGGGALIFPVLWVIGMAIGFGLDWIMGIGIVFVGGCGGCILTSAIKNKKIILGYYSNILTFLLLFCLD